MRGYSCAGRLLLRKELLTSFIHRREIAQVGKEYSHSHHEASKFESASRFLIFDRDAKYGLKIPVAVRSLRMSPAWTSFESPRQNSVAKR